MTRTLLAVCLFLAPAARADDGPKMDDRTKAAVERALNWLKRQQSADGSWKTSSDAPGDTAVTSFAVLAYLANGHLPNQGPFGEQVARGVRFLLASQRADGYLVGPHGGKMYHHGMATLALTQVYGMTADEEVRKGLKRAIDLIVRCQNPEGGWRYQPGDNDADISVTIMQVMALRGAKDSGLHVPDTTIEKALRYIDRCQEPASGGYRYQPRNGGAGFARTAAGVCVLQLGGQYESQSVARGVSFLMNRRDDEQYFWYGHYYAAHAVHQFGGKAWKDYYTRMRTLLLATQRASGYWLERREEGVGPAYQTAIAVLVLSVPANYLPIYQR
jgi:prenyltransferase beta subunit